MRALRIRFIVLPLVSLWILAGFFIFIPSGQAEEKIILSLITHLKLVIFFVKPVKERTSRAN